MPKQPRYTPEHAAAGLDTKFPEIETWPNQFPGYEIVIDDPEFTSVCPKTGLPDFGVITLRYQPDKLCLELKSYKEYLHAYRNLGIFQENIVNRVLEDAVRWAKPVWAEVKGEFRPRGGISTTVVARWPRGKEASRKGKRHPLRGLRRARRTCAGHNSAAQHLNHYSAKIGMLRIEKPVVFMRGKC